MPELPEVETTRVGIAPHVSGRTISKVVVRNASLRWPVPSNLVRTLRRQTVQSLERRAKYLLFRLDRGHLMLHLGMSGSLRINPIDIEVGPYDHFELQFADGQCLRLRDPRRFGSVHYVTGDVSQHPLLASLGPEPLDEHFSGDYLYQRSRKRRQSVKTFIMDSRTVVGVGNIYASESLYEAGILPGRQAGRVSRARYDQLAGAIKSVLQRAIAKGGTTLRDFISFAGQPGYFRHDLQVYDRAGEPCRGCGQPVRNKRLGQRSTFYCSRCQS
ncbi:formamidopyrimidine-DNA glycosylase [Methylohalomonas lacus]|uniref:Formamidopyrimidine-DNA glycosylase n=1 Tax=Methylohalomonas lacus TaxID=398773 RepID=A0AAE3HMN1_9GAMM|nr:bifunctional DNA-formamidopyrimidine glycosylase/DNA-(apurinic or apyrimidinic site) lyase [Methylohalomonas lacus]MCS3903287.1 formamidopyrimidine-DNA glycosylase [Methylohalomonas lacus]